MLLSKFYFPQVENSIASAEQTTLIVGHRGLLYSGDDYSFRLVEALMPSVQADTISTTASVFNNSTIE